MLSPESRQAALERASRGDADALGELLGEFRPYVHCLIQAGRRGFATPRFDDSDLTQDAVLLAHQAFGQFRGETVAEFTVWIQRVARTAVTRAFRAHRDAGKRDAGREVEIEDAAAITDGRRSPGSSAVQHEYAALVAAAINRLPEDMRAVVHGRHLEDLSYAELADRIGRSEGAVRVLYTRALRKLREEFSISVPPA